jgi:hypothetical protein
LDATAEEDRAMTGSRPPEGTKPGTLHKVIIHDESMRLAEWFSGKWNFGDRNAEYPTDYIVGYAGPATPLTDSAGAVTEAITDADFDKWVRDLGVSCAVDVAELPDRTSPDDQPEMMLVSAEELSQIIEGHLLEHRAVLSALPSPPPVEGRAEREVWEAAIAAIEIQSLNGGPVFDPAKTLRAFRRRLASLPQQTAPAPDAGYRRGVIAARQVIYDHFAVRPSVGMEALNALLAEPSSSNGES